MVQLAGLSKIAAAHQHSSGSGRSQSHLHDLLVISGLLSTELITRETNDDESAIAVFVVQSLQTLVLRGEATAEARV